MAEIEFSCDSPTTSFIDNIRGPNVCAAKKACGAISSTHKQKNKASKVKSFDINKYA